MRNAREVVLFKSRQVGMPVWGSTEDRRGADRAPSCYDEETGQEAENEKKNDRINGFVRS